MVSRASCTAPRIGARAGIAALREERDDVDRPEREHEHDREGVGQRVRRNEANQDQRAGEQTNAPKCGFDRSRCSRIVCGHRMELAPHILLRVPTPVRPVRRVPRLHVLIGRTAPFSEALRTGGFHPWAAATAAGSVIAWSTLEGGVGERIRGRAVGVGDLTERVAVGERTDQLDDAVDIGLRDGFAVPGVEERAVRIDERGLDPALVVADDLGRGGRPDAVLGFEQAVFEREHDADEVRDRDTALRDEREMCVGQGPSGVRAGARARREHREPWAEEERRPCRARRAGARRGRPSRRPASSGTRSGARPRPVASPDRRPTRARGLAERHREGVRARRPAAGLACRARFAVYSVIIELPTGSFRRPWRGVFAETRHYVSCLRDVHSVPWRWQDASVRNSSETDRFGGGCSGARSTGNAARAGARALVEGGGAPGHRPGERRRTCNGPHAAQAAMRAVSRLRTRVARSSRP